MELNIAKLNEDIKQFPEVFPITDDMKTEFSGVSRLIMIDRYSFKDTKKETLSLGDLVVLTVKPDPSFPARGLGFVTDILVDEVRVEILDDYQAQSGTDILVVPLASVEKPLEVFYEQIAKRVAKGLSEVEAKEKQAEVFGDFYRELSEQNFVPAGRVLYGAGANTDVTYFNCYVMPMPKDSREGIGEHRNEVMEIMSRGGGKQVGEALYGL